MRPSPLMPMRMEGRKYNVPRRLSAPGAPCRAGRDPEDGPVAGRFLRPPGPDRLTDRLHHDRVRLLHSRHPTHHLEEPPMIHGNPGRTLAIAGLALLVCFCAERP